MVLPSHMPIPKVILSSSITNIDAQLHQLCANLSLLGNRGTPRTSTKIGFSDKETEIIHNHQMDQVTRKCDLKLHKNKNKTHHYQQQQKT